MNDYAGSKSYSYDDLDNILSQSTTFNGLTGLSFPITYAYNPDGSRAAMNVPTQSGTGTFTYNYDAGGRLASLTNPYQATTSWNYLANSWVSGVTLGNNAATNYTLNPLGLLTQLTNQAPGGATLSAMSPITYDGNDDITSLTAGVTGLPQLSGTTTYSQDPLEQLTQESSTRNGSYTNTFAYDNAGNPTTFKGNTNNFNTDNEFQQTSFYYDGNGNPCTYKGEWLSFDQENHLTSFSYGYQMTATTSVDGLRASKSDNASGLTTYFLYDGQTLVGEIDGAGNVATVYTNDLGGSPLARSSATNTTWYQYDAQGNVAQRLDATGNVLSSDLYDAYGNLLAGGDPTDPLGYNAQAGYYTDHETGLTLCTFRYYDPSMGRWLNRDPIGYAGGSNLYGYCGNSPVSYMDPLGLNPASDWYMGGMSGFSNGVDHFLFHGKGVWLW